MENNSANTKQIGGIIVPDSNFNFKGLHLADPISIQGGQYFTKITNESAPLYIQTPKCLTKQGFAKTGKKIFTDLIFNNHDEPFIQWLLDLESVCEDLIYQKSTEWFQNPLELDDIQSAFNSSVKIQKTGNYILRSNVKINSLTQDPLIRIYNESENVLTMDDVIPQTNIIVILEVKGVKFTTRNFHLDIEMKQVMCLNKDLFENCLINPVTSQIPHDTSLGKISTQFQNNTNIDTSVNEDLLDKEDGNENEKQEKKDMSLEDEDVESLGSLSSNSESDDDEESVVKLTLGEMVTLDDVDSIEKETLVETQKKDEDLEIASANILSENQNNLVEKAVNAEKDENIEVSHEKEKNNKTNNETSDNEEELAQLTANDNNIFQDIIDPIKEDEKVLVENILNDIKPSLSNDLDEIDINPIDSDTEILKLKQPSDYYYGLYKQVRETARQQKQSALENYMKAKNIKNTYLLDDVSDTSDDINNIGSDIEESIELE